MPKQNNTDFEDFEVDYNVSDYEEVEIPEQHSTEQQQQASDNDTSEYNYPQVDAAEEGEHNNDEDDDVVLSKLALKHKANVDVDESHPTATTTTANGRNGNHSKCKSASKCTGYIIQAGSRRYWELPSKLIKFDAVVFEVENGDSIGQITSSRARSQWRKLEISHVHMIGTAEKGLVPMVRLCVKRDSISHDSKILRCIPPTVMASKIIEWTSENNNKPTFRERKEFNAKYSTVLKWKEEDMKGLNKINPDMFGEFSFRQVDVKSILTRCVTPDQRKMAGAETNLDDPRFITSAPTTTSTATAAASNKRQKLNHQHDDNNNIMADATQCSPSTSLLCPPNPNIDGFPSFVSNFNNVKVIMIGPKEKTSFFHGPDGNAYVMCIP